MSEQPLFAISRSKEKEPLFKDTSFKDKIIIILLMPPTLIMVLYIIIRATFDKKKRQEWIDASDPNFVREDPNPMPSNEASEEEWDRYYRTNTFEMEKWDREHRVERFFLFLFANLVLRPCFFIYEQVTRFKDRRG